MRAHHIHVTNQKEIEQARQMAIPEPDPETKEVPFLFRMADVEAAWIEEGDIVLQYPGGQYALRFTQELWTKLENQFNQDIHE